MNERYNELKTRLGAINDLTRVGALLDWDTQVLMPRRGAEVVLLEEVEVLVGMAGRALLRRDRDIGVDVDAIRLCPLQQRHVGEGCC